MGGVVDKIKPHFLVLQKITLHWNFLKDDHCREESLFYLCVCVFVCFVCCCFFCVFFFFFFFLLPIIWSLLDPNCVVRSEFGI